MEFFTREICVCAHLTQTRDALEKCAGMEISMKKRILTGILTGLICLTMAACGDADVDATGSVESTGKIEVSEESEKESIEASATGSEKGSAAGSEKGSTEASASGSEKGSTEVSASGSEKGSTEASASGSEKGSAEVSASGSEKGSTEVSASGSEKGSTEASATGNSGQNVDGKTDGSVDVTGEAHPITEEEYNSFSKTCEATDASGFDDFEETLNQDYTGTWYDPVMGEAIRLCEEGAYVYIPYLNEYGDTLYEWEVIDRAKRGLCPELAIYISGRGAGPLAYYVAGYREGYFYGNSQGFIFYKQD